MYPLTPRSSTSSAWRSGTALSSSDMGAPATFSTLTMVVPPCFAHSVRIARKGAFWVDSVTKPSWNRRSMSCALAGTVQDNKTAATASDRKLMYCSGVLSSIRPLGPSAHLSRE